MFIYQVSSPQVEIVRQVAYCSAYQKLASICITMSLRDALLQMNITVLIQNLLVKRTEENSVLSVFSLLQLLKKSKETIPITKSKTTLSKNAALHPKHLQVHH